MTADFDQLREIFLAAVERYTPDQWGAYLEQACAGKEELRRQAVLLLKAHAEGGGGDETGVYQPLPEAAGMVIGPYKLRQPIGEGGMGTVWLAEQTRPVQRLVAVKVVKAGMD